MLAEDCALAVDNRSVLINSANTKQYPDANAHPQAYPLPYLQAPYDYIDSLDIYLTKSLPQWPIFTVDEIRALQWRLSAHQVSANDEPALLAMKDLMHSADPSHVQDMIRLHFTGRYQKNCQILALLALYWKFAGSPSFAADCISKAIALASG